MTLPLSLSLVGNYHAGKTAHLLQSFLESTSTQLTYPGLASLCQTPSLLPPAGLAALFRNSHLSVLFRRPSLPPPPPSQPPRPSSSTTTAADPSSSSAAPARVINDPQAVGGPSPGLGPELFTLVTDSSLVHEGDIVWESLGDVDGGGSEFYDARLRRARVKEGGDWVGRARGGRRPREGGYDGTRSGVATDGAGFEGDGFAGNDHVVAIQRNRFSGHTLASRDLC